MLQIIKEANDDQLLAIVEICFNILRGNLNLKQKYRHKLSKHADLYRSISRSRSAHSARTRIQQGGSIGALAPIIAPILGALAQTLLDKALSNKNEIR